MSDTSLKRQLKVLTIPVFIEMALVMMLGAVDTVMLSRYSDNSVAAVGLDNQLISLVFLVYQFFSMGAAILCAQYIAAGLRKRLVQVVGVALAVNLVLGLAVSALLFFFAEQLLLLMGLRPELMGDGLVYLRLTGALSFFQALSLTFSASLRSADKVVYPMVVTGIVNVVNILGNYALIFGHWGCPQLGVEGAAISTATCRAVAMLLLAIIHFKVHIPRYPLRYFRPIPWQELKNLFYIGIPAMSENISYCLSQVVITYFINQISNEALAARTYCHNMIMFVYLFCLSISQGGDILVGHLVGRTTAASGSIHPWQLFLPLVDDHHPYRFRCPRSNGEKHSLCLHRQRGNHQDGCLGALCRYLPGGRSHSQYLCRQHPASHG